MQKLRKAIEICLLASYMVSISVSGTQRVHIIHVQVCDYCIEYNPSHWQEDGFPPITMIRNVQ